MVGLPTLLITASLLHFSDFQSPWHEPLYVICLTANIGYFTNYVAIKMLFKPYYKTAFGRQGLIPKNQDKLADSLSETLICNFLSSEQWHEYLTHSDLVNKVLAEARQGSRDWLMLPQNIQLLSNFLAEYLRQHEDPINQYFIKIQKELVSGISENVDAQTLLAQGFKWLEKQFEENPAQMHNMIEPIIKTVAENIPQIAEGLVKALDDHIEEQDTFKRGISKMARWSADISVDDIKHYLFRMVASFEFRETLFDGLKTLIAEYKNKPVFMQESINKNRLSNKQEISFSLLVSKLINSNLASINWVDLMINQLRSVAQEPPQGHQSSGKQPQNGFNSAILSIHDSVFVKIEAELADGPLHNWIISELVSMIEKLDLRQMVKNKAADFSPGKLETVFQNMISEQLVFIELLGALLGALSGLALIDIRAFALLTGLLFSYYLADSFFTKRKKQPNQSTF